MGQLQTIREFVLNQRIYGHFLVASSEVRITNDQKKSEFLDLMLMDSTGTIGAKRFDCTASDKDVAIANHLVYATGTVSDYKGTMYLKIEYMEAAPTHIMVDDFVPSAPLSASEMMDFVMSCVDSVDHIYIRQILKWMIDRAGDKLLTYPAAKGMHHNILRGLLFHIYSMLQLAKRLHVLYPWLQWDLLVFGVIAHDIEKVNEVEAANGMVTERTVAGQLLGHITQGVVLVETAFSALRIEDDELKVVLQHMILSHHDRPDWGSPVPPHLPEAYMLHEIDNMDAKMYSIHEAVKAMPDDAKFTDGIAQFRGRKMYRWKSGI